MEKPFGQSQPLQRRGGPRLYQQNFGRRRNKHARRPSRRHRGNNSRISNAILERKQSENWFSYLSTKQASKLILETDRLEFFKNLQLLICGILYA